MNSDSVNKQINALTKPFRERAASPFFGPFIYSFIIIFWDRILVVLDLGRRWEDKFSYIKNNEATGDEWFWFWMIPIFYFIFHFYFKSFLNQLYFKVENEALKNSTIGGLRDENEALRQEIKELNNEMKLIIDGTEEEDKLKKQSLKEINDLKTTIKALENEKKNLALKLEQEYERIQTIQKEKKREEQRQIIIKTELSFIHKAIETFFPYINKSNVPKGHALHNLLGLKLINTLNFVSNRLFRENLQKEGKLLNEQKDKIASRLNAEDDPSLELKNLSKVLSSIDDKLTDEEFHFIESAANDLDNSPPPSRRGKTDA